MSLSDPAWETMNSKPPRRSLGDDGEEPIAPSEEEVVSSRGSERELQRTARIRERLAERNAAQEAMPNASQINLLINNLNNTARTFLATSSNGTRASVAADLRPLQLFEALPSLGELELPLNNLDKLKRHEPDLISSTKGMYPRDSRRYWNPVHPALESGHRRLFEGQAAKIRLHLLFVDLDNTKAGIGLSDGGGSVVFWRYSSLQRY